MAGIIDRNMNLLTQAIFIQRDAFATASAAERASFNAEAKGDYDEMLELIADHLAALESA